MIDGFLALYIFMLAAFTGKEIIGRVPVILHTPLMSGSNFVHGIVLVGAMVALANAESPLAKAIGFIGVILGAGNAARRLRRDRTHARNVQVEQGREEVRALASRAREVRRFAPCEVARAARSLVRTSCSLAALAPRLRGAQRRPHEPAQRAT